MSRLFQMVTPISKLLHQELGIKQRKLGITTVVDEHTKKNFQL